jgi:Protein of unknown function (DUF2970)
MSADLKAAALRRGSFMQTIKAVAWSFFGVRKSSDYEVDMSQLNPLHVVAAGIIGALGFILVLLLLVRWILASGIAA